YLGWVWFAKYQLTQSVLQSTLVTEDTRVFSTPTPFNSFMWRIVLLEGDDYQEGFYHFLFPKKIQYTSHTIDRSLFKEAAHITAIDQLQWFADGYNRIDIIDDSLVVSDLRMGFEDNYAFRHVVAKRENGVWQEITSEQLPSELNSDDLVDFWAAFTNSDK
ncbi:MAG: hypothetical protein KJO69_05700, partial [Gammaproteobacteria bacterium]|nr:hypothetical protein [Gammaproteobacteria bacterium]